MRFFPALAVTASVLSGTVPVQAWAQNNSVPAPATPAPQAAVGTPFAPLPGTTVTLEVDARDGDLLGMVKDLLSGMSKMTTPNAPTGSKAMDAFSPFANLQLETILKEVTHLHVLQFKKAPAPVSGTALVETDKPDAVGFYEKQFLANGGRRLLYSGQGSRVAIIGFDSPQGMAFVMEDGSSVTVGQLDGKLNVKPLATILFGFMGMGQTMETMEAVPAAPVKKHATKPAGTGTES